MFSFLKISNLQDFNEQEHQQLLIENSTNNENNDTTIDMESIQQETSIDNVYENTNSETINSEIKNSFKNKTQMPNNKPLSNLFLKNIYEYYYYKGSMPIIIDKITYLLINYFLIFFINFITNCINYRDILLHFKPGHYLSEYIFIKNIWPKNTYIVLCFMVFIFYSICLTINTFTEIKNTYKIKKIYKNYLNIEDSELEHINWHHIVSKLKNISDDPNLNIYTVNAKILKKENIMIYLYKNNLSFLPNSSRFLEWNFVFCFIEPLFDKNNDINELSLIKDNLKRKIQNRCKIVFFINLISLPFIIYILLIYFIIKYGEIFYHNPEITMNKIWSTKGFWKLRYYNELKHEYNIRNHSIKLICQEINTFYSNLEIKEIILRFINFVLGSFFVLLVILSFVNEILLTDGIIFANRTTLWVMTIIGAILTINKKFINLSSVKKNKYYEHDENLYEKLNKEVPIINPRYFDFKNRKKLNKILNSLYYTKIYYLIKEFLCICISPYYIIKLYNNVDLYINLVVNNLHNHYIMGYIIDKSSLTNINYLKSDPHCYYTYYNFVKNNPEWKSDILNFENLDNSINNKYIWNNNDLEQNSFTMLYSYN